MGYDIPAAMAEIAKWQSGVVSRQQLLEAGLSAQLIKRRLERGRWQQLHWGVYAAFTGPPPRTAWLWAAVLRAGPGAVLSHLTAAELHRLLDTPAELIFVTPPPGGSAHRGSWSGPPSAYPEPPSPAASRRGQTWRRPCSTWPSSPGPSTTPAAGRPQ